jgi:hypothetical protein
LYAAFTGQFYNEKGYPKNYPKTEQDADESKVFRYTAYKIIKSNHRRILNEIEEGKNK